MPTWDEMNRQRTQQQMTTPSIGGRNTAGSQPQVQPSIWDTQPKSQNALMQQRTNQFGAMQPSTPAATGFTQAPMQGQPTNGLYGQSYYGGRGNYMDYGSNAGGLRMDPNYLPEVWDYKESPEYQQRLAWAQRDLNRLLLSRGRSDSTGGEQRLARQQSEMAGQEIDKQYQRALQANMQNYSRYAGANTENYGRTRGEEQTGWNRAWDLGEQDWNRNYQLANMGLGATNTGVQAGNQTAFSLATLLSQNGATQASLALSSGAVSADTIKRMLDLGIPFAQIEAIFRGSGGGGTPMAYEGNYNPTGAVVPNLPAPSSAGIGGTGMFERQDDWFRG